MATNKDSTMSHWVTDKRARLLREVMKLAGKKKGRRDRRGAGSLHRTPPVDVEDCHPLVFRFR